jgi:hypothetical protein
MLVIKARTQDTLVTQKHRAHEGEGSRSSWRNPGVGRMGAEVAGTGVWADRTYGAAGQDWTRPDACSAICCGNSGKAGGKFNELLFQQTVGLFPGERN